MTDLPQDPEQENTPAPHDPTATPAPADDSTPPTADAPLDALGSDVLAQEGDFTADDSDKEEDISPTEEEGEGVTAEGAEATESLDGEEPRDDDSPAPKGYDFFADVEGTRSLAHTVESGVRFQTPLNALARLEQSVMDLPAELQLLHERHVIYPVAIGEEIGRLTHRLRAAATDARQIAGKETAYLEPRVTALWEQIARNDEVIATDGYPAHAEAIAAALHEAETLKARMERGEQDVQEAFNEVANQLRPITRHVGALTQAATYLKEASWELNGGEAVRAADEGIYHHAARGNQRGILFITDQRLIFEQREEVESGVLFMKRRKFVKEAKITSPLIEVRVLSAEGHSLHLKLGLLNPTTARFTVSSAEEIKDLIEG